MKPKDAEGALNSMKPHIKPHQLIVSVLAGISISFIENTLHDMQPVIRIMPNTSSAIGASTPKKCDIFHFPLHIVGKRTSYFKGDYIRMGRKLKIVHAIVLGSVLQGL